MVAKTREGAERERVHLVEKFIRDSMYTGFRSAADGINHIAFVAEDLEAVIEFYTKVVGLRLLRVRALDDDPLSTMVFFDLGRGELLAFLKLHDVDTAARFGVGGIHHFALTVDRDQYKGFQRRLDERGLKYKTISHEILDSISTIDPSGVEVELSVWNIDPEEVSQH